MSWRSHKAVDGPVHETRPWLDRPWQADRFAEVPLVLREAARRVALESVDWAGDDASWEEVSETLASLVVSLARRNEAPLDPRLRSPLGRRLLAELRAAVIQFWEGWKEVPPAGEVLRTFAAMESVRLELEPDLPQQFGSRLSGPDGLNLVVEVAHDLRSPLTSILFLAELLMNGQSGDVNDLQHRQLGLVYSAALGLSELASNVIETARGGERLAEREPTSFSVSATLESVLDITRPMAEEKGLVIRITSPESDQRVGYPIALNRVLLNLTTNAIKFTEQGFVELVAKDRGDHVVEFSVRDTGRGIGSEALRTLFAPFRRVQGEDRYTFSGTGLGLSLCRRLVGAMESELEVETKPGWGTRFSFSTTLPQDDRRLHGISE